MITPEARLCMVGAGQITGAILIRNSNHGNKLWLMLS